MYQHVCKIVLALHGYIIVNTDSVEIAETGNALMFTIDKTNIALLREVLLSGMIQYSLGARLLVKNNDTVCFRGLGHS